MEFTEIQEIDYIATYARTFKGKQMFPNPEGPHYSSQPSFSAPNNENILDYEKLFHDSPPTTPLHHSHLEEIRFDDEPLEKIINEINLSWSKRLESVESLILKPKMQILVSCNSEMKKEKNEEQDDQSSEDKELNKTQEITMNRKDKEYNNSDKKGIPNFEKGNEEFISKSYFETKSLKSFLGTNLKFALQSVGSSHSLNRAFRIFFLGDSIKMITSINLSSQVHDVVIQCLNAFKTNPDIDQSIIRFPERPEAYDLKLKLDGPALDRNKELKNFKSGQSLFITETLSFDPSSPVLKAKKSQDEDFMLDIQLKCTNDIEFTAKVHLSSKALVKEIYTSLLNQGITSFQSQNFNMRVFHREDYEKRFLESKNFLDINMPLRNLRKYLKNTNVLELELVRKKFADEPLETRKRSEIMKELYVHEESSFIIPIHNEVSARCYQEFEVITISQNGKRQIKTMGIDGYRILHFSKKSKEEQGGMTDLLNAIFNSRPSTILSEILLTDILNAKDTSPNSFELDVREEGVIKCYRYEVTEKNVAAIIIAKIKFIKALDDKGR